MWTQEHSEIMAGKTPRLNLGTYAQGDEDWSHNDTVEALDIRLGAGQTAEGRISEINDKTGRVSERV